VSSGFTTDVEAKKTYVSAIDCAPQKTFVRGCFSVILALLMPALGYTFFNPVYQTNDDPIMDMIARGIGIAANPSPHLLFINILVGRLLNFLYERFPGLHWYRVCALICQLAPTSAVCWVALSRRLTWPRLIILSSYLLVFEFDYYVRPNFTLTATAAATAAVVVWADAISRGRRLSAGRLLAIWVLALVAALARFHAMVMIFLLGLPAMVILLAGLRESRVAGAGARWRRLAGPALGLLIPAVLAWIVFLYNQQAYRSAPGWEDFYEFNLLRAHFTDYQRAGDSPTGETIFDAVGWSQNDLAMLQEWFFADHALYNIDTMRRVVAASPGPDLSVTTWAALSLLAQESTRLFLAAALLPIFFVCRPKSTQAILTVTVLWAGILVFLILFYFRHCPPWITAPLFGFVVALSLALSWDTRHSQSIGQPLFWIRFGWGLVVLCLLVESGLKLRAESALTRDMHQSLRRAIRTLDPRPNQLYVVWGWGMTFPFELLLSEDDFAALKDFKMLGTGFCAQTPLESERLREFGISDIHRALFTQEDVYLISTPELNKLFIRFVAEHYGVELQAKPVLIVNLEDRGNGTGVHQWSIVNFGVYRLRPAKLPAGSSTSMANWTPGGYGKSITLKLLNPGCLVQTQRCSASDSIRTHTGRS
jgi:hypothetical protein